MATNAKKSVRKLIAMCSGLDAARSKTNSNTCRSPPTVTWLVNFLALNPMPNNHCLARPAAGTAEGTHPPLKATCPVYLSSAIGGTLGSILSSAGCCKASSVSGKAAMHKQTAPGHAVTSSADVASCASPGLTLLLDVAYNKPSSSWCGIIKRQTCALKTAN